MNYCVDCSFNLFLSSDDDMFKGLPRSQRKKDVLQFCSNDELLDPVTKEIRQAAILRADINLCGPSGKFYEKMKMLVPLKEI